ncbi:hypothetical protein FHG87_000810 [Trinorchestia longiramus]|nr:hypothetical protein FHG87_000810 [Trinorchestia longiramus]
MEECCFCYFNYESSAIIENQSRKILELSRQLKLSRRLELLAGRLETIEIQQKQNYEHELRLQSSETRLDQHLYGLLTSPRVCIETIAKRSNFHLNTKNSFNALKDKMKNNINSTEEHAIQ